ncbi:heavy-metal-associated domain-containing protein [Saccharomonospora azurea]|uniref:heavy-metal-associated domain-containing protein n=1 Tax=Saccharomonospora azurea TaxID=40988 RepID=UPI003D8E095C
MGRLEGVGTVAVGLTTHEQVLVDYDPDIAEPEQILGTLRDLSALAARHDVARHHREPPR